MDKSTHEEHLYQPLQTNSEQFKIAVTFPTGFNGVFNVTDQNSNFCFMKSITDEDAYIQITSPPGAYKIESLDKENKRFIIDEGHFTETKCPFTIKPNFSTLGSIIEISPKGPIITFMPNYSIRDLLGFNASTFYEEYILSPSPVDIIWFDNIFIETDIAKGIIFEGKRSGIIHNCTMVVKPGFEYI